jgi:hypothetical protein
VLTSESAITKVKSRCREEDTAYLKEDIDGTNSTIFYRCLAQWARHGDASPRVGGA